MHLSKIEGSPSLELVNLVLEMKGRGEKVVSLAIGDPSMNTPREIIEAAYKSMISGNVHYVSSSGTPDVLQAIKNKVARKNAIRAESENCAFLTTKFSVYASLVAISDTTFDALIPDPGYFYREPVILSGGNPIFYPLSEDFSLDLEEIRKSTTPNTKAILINSPSNPTSKVLGESELRELYDFCSDRGIYIISDEAYEDLIYENVKHFSVGSLEDTPENVISLFSLSKSYCMTGWRAGYVVASKRIMHLLNKFLENTLTCLPPFIEKASAYALDNCDSQIFEFKKEFEKRRNIIMERIEGIDSLTPNKIEGAFYAFPSYKRKTGSIDLAKIILQKKNLALLPGSAFGEKGEGRLRISFSGPMEELEDGMKRLKDFFDSS